MISKIKLTVPFNDPFWIGIFEIIENDEYRVCKVTFGAEPKDEETYELILKKLYSLKFSNPILFTENEIIERKQNPKRLQRSIIYRNECFVLYLGTFKK